MNNENLIEIQNRPESEQREMRRKAGIKSGEARRRKRDMREAMKIILSMKMKPGEEFDIENVEDLEALKGKNITLRDVIALRITQDAAKGSVADKRLAAEMDGALIGEVPQEESHGDGGFIDALTSSAASDWSNNDDEQ